MMTGIDKCIQAKKDKEMEKDMNKARMDAMAKMDLERMYKQFEK